MTQRYRRLCQKASGFSLIELLAAVVILSLLASTVAVLWQDMRRLGLGPSGAQGHAVAHAAADAFVADPNHYVANFDAESSPSLYTFIFEHDQQAYEVDVRSAPSDSNLRASVSENDESAALNQPATSYIWVFVQVGESTVVRFLGIQEEQP